jgi:hypothetical protein
LESLVPFYSRQCIFKINDLSLIPFSFFQNRIKQAELVHNQKKIRIPVLGHVILPRVTLEVVDKSWLILLSLSLSYADPATA